MVEEKKMGKFERGIIWLSIIVGIILVLILIVIKINAPSFSILAFISSLIGVVLFFSAIIGFSWWWSRRKRIEEKSSLQEYEKLPKPVTLEQCRDIAKRATVNPEYAEYINGCLGEHVELLGKGQKSLIYTYKAKGYYNGDIFYILINMHYPNDRRTILCNPKLEEYERAKMYLAVSPEPSPDVREIRTLNPILGTEQTVIETTQKEEKKEAKEEEKSL